MPIRSNSLPPPPDAAGPPGAAQRRPTRVAHLIRELEALSLSRQDGELLGAEDALLARFGVSRPTLRQAAKVVEADSLITVRRGLKGGFYAARPDAASAIRAPARYLRLHDATLKQMHEVSRLLAPTIAARAAACPDAELRTELKRLADELAARDGASDSVRQMIEAEGALGSVLARMTNNPVMVLLQQISFAFGRLEQDLKFYRAPEDRREAKRLQLAMAQAVLACDQEKAHTVASDRLALIAGWLG